MPAPGKKRCTGCPIAYALDTFGDRWSLMVIRDLMFMGKSGYGEFLDGAEGIATNVLADRLKHLEAEEIIQKLRDPENRRRYIYSLTEKGRDLAPLMLEVIRWSGKYDSESGASKKILKRIKNDRDGFEVEIRARLKADLKKNKAPT